MYLKSIGAGCCALLLAACNPMAQLDGADERISRFHSVYNTGDSDALYQATAREFRDATTQEQMDTIVSIMTDRLGKVESTKRASFNLNSNNGQTVSTITMTTQFEKGEASETYTLFGTSEDMRIAGWDVNSELLQDPTPEPEEVAEPAQ